jgi:hypothetical protein
MPGTFDWRPQGWVTNPTHWLVEVYRNYWWNVNAKGEVLIYRDKASIYPQCSPYRQVAERLGSKIPDVTGVVQIPLAFIPREPRDY